MIHANDSRKEALTNSIDPDETPAKCGVSSGYVPFSMLNSFLVMAVDNFKYTMHNKFSNFLCFPSFLRSSLCSADQF